MKRVLSVLLTAILAVGICAQFTGCGNSSSSKGEIKFADVGWDSVRFNNAVAGLIAQSGYGYTWSETSGSTPIMHEALTKGEIDVNMEEWTDNIQSYAIDLKAGLLQEMGTNFDDNIQGFYVPRYVIEGDASRGIEPMAPDLKTVQDLKKYASLFKDPEDPSKGRIYGAIPGWEVNEIMKKKVSFNGLDSMYNYFQPGSDSALSAAFTSAYQKGEPIVGYYWSPTWLLGKLDMVLLEDVPYTDAASYKEGRTACPSVDVTIATSNSFANNPNNADYCSFLKRYRTSSALINEALAHMQDNPGVSYTDTAKWFLTEHQDLIDQWVQDPDKAEAVKASLGLTEKKKNYFLEFPFQLPIDVNSFDTSVKSFASSSSAFFNAQKNGINGLISAISGILSIIPWWLMLALVFVAGWKINHKIRTGVLYAVLLSAIGMIGLWDMMYETLSIVIASVLISLLLGLPIGVLISGSDRANRIVRPILDTMQTMPVFVYLIPAVLFFGLGKAPAVIATLVYAIVPVIRLTSHGIRQVDPEVVEAAKSFGSTRMQTLWKVQIPQAMPTILTGVNQTLMMAMSMVVTCSMIGASGLGMEVLISVNRIEIGRGLLAGSAVVIIAILMDRMTQGMLKKGEEKTDGRQ